MFFDVVVIEVWNEICRDWQIDSRVFFIVSDASPHHPSIIVSQAYQCSLKSLFFFCWRFHLPLLREVVAYTVLCSFLSLCLACSVVVFCTWTEFEFTDYVFNNIQPLIIPEDGVTSNTLVSSNISVSGRIHCRSQILYPHPQYLLAFSMHLFLTKQWSLSDFWIILGIPSNATLVNVQVKIVGILHSQMNDVVMWVEKDGLRVWLNNDMPFQNASINKQNLTYNQITGADQYLILNNEIQAGWLSFLLIWDS